MKRWIILAAAAAAALLLAPDRTTDVAQLEPVQLLYVYQDAGEVCVETDTGASGKGLDLRSAMEDLKATTPGKVFLETAEFLLLTEETLSALPALSDMLRPSTEICLTRKADPETAVQYLSVHRPNATLKDWTAERIGFPILIMTEEQYHLVS